MARPFDVVAGVVDDDRFAAFPDLIADGFVDLEFVAGIEPELDPVLDLAAIQRCSVTRATAEKRMPRVADVAQDCVQALVATQSYGFRISVRAPRSSP